MYHFSHGALNPAGSLSLPHRKPLPAVPKRQHCDHGSGSRDLQGQRLSPLHGPLFSSLLSPCPQGCLPLPQFFSHAFCPSMVFICKVPVSSAALKLLAFSEAVPAKGDTIKWVFFLLLFPHPEMEPTSAGCLSPTCCHYTPMACKLVLLSPASSQKPQRTNSLIFQPCWKDLHIHPLYRQA